METSYGKLYFGNVRVGTFAWKFRLGIAVWGFPSRSLRLVWRISLGPFRLGPFVWELCLGNAFGNYRFGGLVKGLSFGNFGLGPSAKKLSFGNVRLGTLAWKLSLGNCAWELSPGDWAPEAGGARRACLPSEMYPKHRP